MLPDAPDTPRHFRIGPIEVLGNRNLIRTDKDSVTFEPKITDVLCTLASEPRQVISRFDLISRVWQVDYGADESLTRAISLLRKGFKALDPDTTYIETVPKRGYRLCVDVVPLTDMQRVPGTVSEGAVLVTEGENKSRLQVSAKPSKTVRPLLWGAGVLVAGVIVISSYYGGEAAGRYIGENFGTTSPVLEAGRSVAVLPFTDMSEEGDQGAFSQGVSEQIMHNIAELPHLKVVGRAASFSYKEQADDPKKIGRDLKVSHFIDGSVRKQGARVRVGVQLIDTVDGVAVLSKTYDGDLNDMFALQDRIASDLTDELRLTLSIAPDDEITLEETITVPEIVSQE